MFLGFALIPLTAAADFSGVVRVIDGDTLDVGDVRVRLHGIDAPEMNQVCVAPGGREIRCGSAVRDEVRRRHAGNRARCEPLDTDRYGRIVARCWQDGADIGRGLVLDGLAFAYRRYSWDYDLEEKSAASAGRGLHAMSVQSPEQFRRMGTQQAPTASAAPGDCVIKGNISGNGHIFHMPGQRDYDATRIDTRKGERWFCTAAEARAAGWRPARR